MPSPYPDATGLMHLNRAPKKSGRLAAAEVGVHKETRDQKS